MNQDFNTTYQSQYNGNRVIERGYEIYDEWVNKGLSSRKIVSFVECTLSALRKKRTGRACIEALSCLFALDFRINEKYNSFWKRLYSYFSWRRETNTLKQLKNTLHITENTDLRTAIEIELQRVRENLETEESNDGDDETRGGKRNGKAEEEATATEEKGQEQASEENAEKTAEAEESQETAKEKAEDNSDQSPTDEPINESDEKRQTNESPQEEAEIPEQEEAVVEDKPSESKEENNGPDEASEPSENKHKEERTYNDAVDSPPLYENFQENKPAADKIDLIDEVIMDNMVKGKEDFINHKPVEDVNAEKGSSHTEDSVTQQDRQEGKGTDKDAYLYDKTLVNDREHTQQNDKVETKQESQKAEAKEQNAPKENIESKEPKEPIQRNDNVQSTEQEHKPLREALQVDINATQEAKVVHELNDTMSLESKLAYIQMQADVFREQIMISNQELGIDDHVGVEKIPVLEQSSQPSVTNYRK